MPKLIKIFLTTFLILIISVSLLSSKTLALENNVSADSTNAVNQGAMKSAAAKENAGKTVNRQSTLAAKFKQEVCVRRAANIQKRSVQMAVHGENLFKVFDSITLRVKNYYEQKLVPNGKVLSDYDKLIADIQAKKGAVAPLLKQAADDANAFSCTTDPAGQLIQFRKDMQSVITGLQAYKKSVRNLIVGVATLAKTEGKDATGSSKPVASPSAAGATADQ